MMPEPLDDFETRLVELERIVTALDSDEIGLDEAMALFEEGILHVRAANQLLEETRGKVEELQRTGVFPVFNDPMESVRAMRMLLEHGQAGR